MPRSDRNRPMVGGVETTAFAGGAWAGRVARLLVLDMVLWPGALLIGGTLVAAWQVRTHPAALAVLALATLVSVLVGIRQWDVMLRAVFLPAPHPAAPHAASGEDPPRPAGRGTTDRRTP